MLSWLHHLSLAELRMTYLKKVYTVCVSTYQMAVLLAYNQGLEHTMTSLTQFTRLPEQELTSTVQTLVDSKMLEVGGAGGGGARGGAECSVSMSMESNVKLNMNYSNKRTRFKVTAALQRDSQQVSIV